MDIKKIRGVISQVKTPFYFYDLKLMKEKYIRLRNNLPKEIEIFYALKANPNKNIVALFGKLSAGADIASMGELAIALRAGISPEKINFAGPGKTIEELELAARKNIASISVESQEEVYILDKLSMKMKKKINLAIRINPFSELLPAAIRMGGGSQQFGIDEEIVPEVIKYIKNTKYLHFIGIHMHTGSQILSEKAIADNMAFLLDYCMRIQDKVTTRIKWINFGGGLGIPYYQGQKNLNVRLLGKMIKAMLNKRQIKLSFKNTRFIIEPGRFLIGEAGIYVTRVLYKKKSRGKTFLIVDGGMHQNLAAAGLLGEGLRRNRIFGTINKKKSKQKEIVTIAGCLCTPLDILARDVRIPKCEAGDYLYITCSGAYSYSASPLMFLNHPFPTEVIM